MKYLLSLGSYFIFCISFSQTNFVPNPSFEDTITCPNNPGQINYTKFWVNPTMASPDYMNSCNTSQFGVPSNYAGTQNARTGKAYALIATFALYPPNLSYSFREYIQVPLNSTLLKNETYCIEFYVSLANGQYTEYAVNNIGAYFSATAVSNTNYDPLPYIPQIVNSSTNPLTNIGVWTKVSGQFIAQGGEQYMTIGNFNSNAASDTVFIKKQTPSFKESVYYIDDVSVKHLDADAGNDVAICKGDSILIGRAANTGITYSWLPASSLSSTTIAQPIASPTVTTTYHLTATLVGGCVKQDTVTVTILNVNAGNDSIICESSSVTLGSTASIGVSYNWQPGTDLSNASIAQPIATPNTSTTYTLTAFANGCTQTDAVSITVLPFQTPASNAGISTTICLGDTLSIGAFVTAGYKYLWSPINNLSDASSSQPFVFPKQTTQYYLIVTDTANNYLCKTSGIDSVLITVDDCPPIIPNIFTPNGDGTNDEFVINDLPEGSSVSIYNRWGVEIISYKLGVISSGTSGTLVWDGRTNAGVACVHGIYYYVLKLGNGETYKGFVELMR